MNIPADSSTGEKVVLVVDDDESMYRFIANILGRSGYLVSWAQDGLECIRRVRNGFRGVILMDVVMPRMTGWQTARLLNEEQRSGILICMLTGTVVPDADAEGLQEGVLDYLHKPFSVADLVTMVDSASAILGQ